LDGTAKGLALNGGGNNGLKVPYQSPGDFILTIYYTQASRIRFVQTANPGNFIAAVAPNPMPQSLVIQYPPNTPKKLKVLFLA